jgi:hypothetical protein
VARPSGSLPFLHFAEKEGGEREKLNDTFGQVWQYLTPELCGYRVNLCTGLGHLYVISLVREEEADTKMQVTERWREGVLARFFSPDDVMGHQPTKTCPYVWCSDDQMTQQERVALIVNDSEFSCNVLDKMQGVGECLIWLAE